MSNPYSLQFGREPKEYIARLEQKDTIVNSFVNDEINIYMATGVRGAGKTAFMSNIKNYFRELAEWLVVEIGTEKDMVSSLVAKLNSKDSLSTLFKNAKINLSFLGFGVEISGTAPIMDYEVALSKMLATIKKHKKKLLVTVDEVVDNQYMREFATTFQILLRDNLPIYLMMTGLYNNIDDLQNERNMTFLHRAPKIHLNPLNIGTMAKNYAKNIGVDKNDALKMAQLTRGYPYAFQLLGYLTYKNGGNYTEVLDEFKQYLDEYVYDKIFSELSDKDKKILYAIALCDSNKVADIRAKINLTTNEFNPYSKRLKRKELIKNSTRGYVELTLPLFDEYIIENYII